MRADSVLTTSEMREAEGALIANGSSVDDLMQIAGRGAGELIWRAAGTRPVTVLCGPGNNGGDGYVIAKLLRSRGTDVAVIAAADPATGAARNARAAFGGPVLAPGAKRSGDLLVDCLFGTGLTRPVEAALANLLAELAASHHRSVAVDLPSGVDADSGALLNDRLPRYALTIALGAWKFAHWSMPAMARMGMKRCVSIGIGEIPGAASLLGAPTIEPPAADAHKYSRGLLGIIGGAMPGAAVLSAMAAMRAGAGYVKLLSQDAPAALPPELVWEEVDAKAVALSDNRIAAFLVGPGLGRDAGASQMLAAGLREEVPVVVDADGLNLLKPEMLSGRSMVGVLTPHEGEMIALERAFGTVDDPGSTRRERALALAKRTGMVVVLKGPDTMIAAPGGIVVCGGGASSWLSVAGTGDVLAGTIASRLAVHRDPLRAAEEGVWLHARAAALSGPAFTAATLALCVAEAVSERTR